jgi:hypothetical protein
MNSNRNIWRDWANRLHRWGLANLAASLLEGLGPLAILGAQIVYLTKPMFNGLLPGDHLQALSELLEDSDQAARFAVFLREDIHT